MSIEKSWGEMNTGSDEDLSSLLQEGKLTKIPSGNPLAIIKRNLVANMAWCSLISIGYIIVIAWFPVWQVQLSLAIVLVFTLWSTFGAWKLYKEIDTKTNWSSSLLQELENHHQSIRHWIQMQQRVSVFVYPFAAAGGFMFGGVLGSGTTVEAFMAKKAALIALPITILVLVPAGYYLARWMFQHSFGKHLHDLQKNINDLQSEK
jgi:NADH:ubiquinone oxidoreductase subunit 2 (subunit N)